MKSLTGTLSLVFGCIAASAFVASIMIAPAFAITVTRDTPSAYTEIVSYDSNVTNPSVDALINTEFHYLDYSPDIDVTYSWDEDFEWVFLKNGEDAFWIKGKDSADAFNNLKVYFAYGSSSGYFNDKDDFFELNDQFLKKLKSNQTNPSNQQ